MAKIKPVATMMNSKNLYINRLGNYLAYLLQFTPMMESMILKDFKGKFKYTALGYFWHVLNPLFQIIIYYFVFTVIFGRDIPYYWAYISTGMFAFVFMSSCISGGCSYITGNKGLITKMAFAREILIFSKVITNLITLTISYILLAILIIVVGSGLSLFMLLIPVVVLFMVIFSTGVALLLSSLTVYIRDLANAIPIIMGCMMFALPIMYLNSQRTTPMMDLVWHINPMYYYIDCIHSVFYLGEMPDLLNLLICVGVAISFFIIGLLIFKKLERGFAEKL